MITKEYLIDLLKEKWCFLKKGISHYLQVRKVIIT